LTDVLRVGVVGCGVGRVHIASFRKLPDSFKVAAVCDLDAEKAKRVADEFGIPTWYTDVEKLYQRQDLDVLDFCTPPYQHFEQIMKALSTGKHVICEKPLVGSMYQVDQIAEASHQVGRKVMPILQYRFGHGLQKLKKLVDEGIAGEPYLSTVEIAWRRRADYYSAPWRGKWETELGGTLLNHAIHQLDMLCFIMGPVQNVFARTASLVNHVEVEDCASLSMEMENGSLASLSATLGSTREISRLRFCFQNLTAESNLMPYSNSDDPWTFTGDSEAIERRIHNSLADFHKTRSDFGEQFTGFYDAVCSNGKLPVDLSDARNLIEIITAVYEAAQTNRSVDLPISKEHPRYIGWAPVKTLPLS
jgi:predicted dehydrogenase